MISAAGIQTDGWLLAQLWSFNTKLDVQHLFGCAGSSHYTLQCMYFCTTVKKHTKNKVNEVCVQKCGKQNRL